MPPNSQNDRKHSKKCKERVFTKIFMEFNKFVSTSVGFTLVLLDIWLIEICIHIYRYKNWIIDTYTFIWTYHGLRIHWRLSVVLKTSKKYMFEVKFFWKCIQDTMHWDKTDVKKVSLKQNKWYKECLLFSFLNISKFYF